MTRRLLSCLLLCAALIAGCPEHKKTTKVTVEGPEKKTEVKIEKTDKK